MEGGKRETTRLYCFLRRVMLLGLSKRGKQGYMRLIGRRNIARALRDGMEASWVLTFVGTASRFVFF